MPGRNELLESENNVLSRSSRDFGETFFIFTKFHPLPISRLGNIPFPILRYINPLAIMYSQIILLAV